MRMKRYKARHRKTGNITFIEENVKVALVGNSLDAVHCDTNGGDEGEHAAEAWPDACFYVFGLVTGDDVLAPCSVEDDDADDGTIGIAIELRDDTDTPVDEASLLILVDGDDHVHSHEKWYC